jgi:membrane-associated phospholipid phosphatase
LITSGAWVGSALFSLLPVDTTNRWDHEPFSFDHAVRGGLAPAAARVSDLLLWSSMTTPIVALLADHADPATAEAILIYAETLAINSLLTGAAKYLVQRPRPYLYDRSPAVQAYARSSGRGGQLSFFSGHSSIAFASAVAGAQLFAVRSRSTAARAAVWGIELAFAAATANLRVRAGQHYYSDVVVGSIVGAAVGVTVPLLHLRYPAAYRPEPAEWGAMALGLVGGILVSQLLPFDQTGGHELPQESKHGRWSLAPILLREGGAGIAVSGLVP